MNGKESDIIVKLNQIVNQIQSGKRKFDIKIDGIDDVDNEQIKSLANNLVQLGQQYQDCYGFIIDLSCGRLYTESPRMNVFANPFKQLHSELRHLTWQIQEIANGDYDQRVSFSGDFSEAINKMIIALRERQVLTERIRENENMFSSFFSTSPDGIVLCDLNHCIINTSDAARRMLYLSEEFYGKAHFNDLIHPEDIEKFEWFIHPLLNGNKKTVFTELRVVSHKGFCFWSEQNASLLLDSNGIPNGYIIIIRDISERKAAEAQLLQYTDELDESNRTKDKLFSIIAHDLKSPFSALLGTSNAMIQEANLENPNVGKFRKFSKIINESANRTYNLLINLLEWSRLQSSRIDVYPESLNLIDIIMENMDIGQTMAMAKNILLKCSTPDDCLLVSDKEIINTILRNLISNAIKYTPQNGLVIVSLLQKDNMYLISVSDSGIGITQENIEKLFRLDSIQSTPGTANEKGTGLGLVLCKDFVHKIGGEIWVESCHGHGATFTFSIKDLSTN